MNTLPDAVYFTPSHICILSFLLQSIALTILFFRFVANQGGRYTKHIYIGSQRVVSKIGDFDSYGSDPRRIQYAGSETDGLSVDYKAKYTGQLQVIKDNYATFAVPYNGEDNNDYVDGKGLASAAMTAAWRLLRHEL